MGSRIRCFWLEPTDQVEMSLRRYLGSSESKCEGSGWGYHNAEATIGRCHKSEVTDLHGDSWPHADPRWPARCACGYEFKPADPWQFNPNSLYKRSDTGELVVLGKAPAGAMWNATWMREGHHYRMVEGITLVVRTPGGDWCVDGPAYPGGGAAPVPNAWARSGAVPDITANPSIHFPGSYHGFLRGGWLEEC